MNQANRWWKTGFAASLIMLLALAFVAPENADARRFGGGASFGKHRMHKPATPPAFDRRAGLGQRPANQRGHASTGMMGGLAGGMLGGLLMGGLIGSLLAGDGFQGVNLFDILVLGGLLWLGFTLLRRKAGASPAAAPMRGAAVRPEFDEAHFLQAAREIFLRMQKAWDAGDLDDIRRFSTPEVADHIARMMREGERHETEVVTLNAAIDDAWVENDMEYVAVAFDAALRERTLDAAGNTIESQDRTVREIWVFAHDPTSSDPTWHLAGIEQAG